ncbi:MAG: hypothetical protein AAB409_00515 [Gemmatimonadota bacterium]|mgnify:FL=1
MATELSSTTITNILEAVPGIKIVLRSPAADAIVNLTRAAAGVGIFDLKDARELMRFAFRRGLINNEEHDRVLGEVEGAAQARQDRIAARKAARDDKKRVAPRPKARPVAKRKSPPKKKVKAARKAKPPKKAKASVKKAVPRKAKPAKKAKPARKAKPSRRPKAKAAKAKKRR